VKGKERVFPAHPPWIFFKNFIEQEDRFNALQYVLRASGIVYSIVQTGAVNPASHLFVSPAKTDVCNATAASSAEIKPADEKKTRPMDAKAAVVLAAHYDKVSGSPGANDNAASIFILIETIQKLLASGAENWLVIFTDKEELSENDGLRDQGAYQLALKLKCGPLGNARFFIFDCCGRGDTVIISTTAGHLLKTENGAGRIHLQKNLLNLRQTAIKKAAEAMLERCLLLPTPFSDDAGFLMAGAAAQLITVLPSREASEFSSLTRRNPIYINSLVNRKLKKRRDQSLFPQTWRIVNTPEDVEESLNPEHFAAMVKFAVALCK
jgi:hypothetical protein